MTFQLISRLIRNSIGRDIHLTLRSTIYMQSAISTPKHESIAFAISDINPNYAIHWAKICTVDDLHFFAGLEIPYDDTSIIR